MWPAHRKDSMSMHSRRLAVLATLVALAGAFGASLTNTTRFDMSRRLPERPASVDMIVKLRSDDRPLGTPNFPRPPIARRSGQAHRASTLELRRKISDTMLAEPCRAGRREPRAGPRAAAGGPAGRIRGA